ncbi:hypothetical protein [Streptomyces sp. Z26]|uniref:hypothetical protein n=1 Tax=Streptomyces sp. Z26 TaxID=2500177 RepID=UPI000EF164AA|nr:hypothetical protein [Streptomyces sp. Z26]RLL68146.1 hypothetical protein D7M15_16325 [Streptomyces sp. Z26]
MPAEIAVPVSVIAHLPGTTPVRGEVGTVTVPVRDGTVYNQDFYRALGHLLVEAGTDMAKKGARRDDDSAEDDS